MTALIRVGLGIAVAGFFSYFFHHSFITAAIISGIGYLIFTVALIGWSLERNGDISFS